MKPSTMDTPEKLTAQGTQDAEKLKKDNPEKLAKYRTQDEEKQKRTIQRNWQHMVHKTKKNKTKPQVNMCWTPLCVSKHT